MNGSNGKEPAILVMFKSGDGPVLQAGFNVLPGRDDWLALREQIEGYIVFSQAAADVESAEAEQLVDEGEPA